MTPSGVTTELASSDAAAARTGGRPAPMSTTVETTMGVPKPATASSSAPNRKAMTMVRIRGSGDIRPKARVRTSKCPDSTVSRYTQTALTTVHMIGKRPKTAPSTPALSADPTGMP